MGFGFGFGYTPKTHTLKTQKMWVKPQTHTHTQKPKFSGFIPKSQKKLGLGKTQIFGRNFKKKLCFYPNPNFLGFRYKPSL
jgi:hypothetical protein